MKKFRWLALASALVLLGAILYLGRNCPAGMPLPQFWQVSRQIRQALQLVESAQPDLSVPLDQAQIDQLEALLAESGFAVVDTDAVYSDYLATPKACGSSGSRPVRANRRPRPFSTFRIPTLAVCTFSEAGAKTAV